MSRHVWLVRREEQEREAERHPVAAMQVVSFADMRIQPRCPPVHLLLSGRLACQPLRADWGCYDDSHIAR